jgi:hypothetical protein
MRTGRAWKFLVAFGLLIMVAACRTAPIYNAQSASFNRELSMSQATRAIQAAGAELGWDMTPEGTGQMRGVLNLRSHQAVVDITYDTRTFSIAYVDSTNLNYNGSDIHKNYNSWVQNLEREIRAEAARM